MSVRSIRRLILHNLILPRIIIFREKDVYSVLSSNSNLANLNSQKDKATASGFVGMYMLRPTTQTIH